MGSFQLEYAREIAQLRTDIALPLITGKALRDAFDSRNPTAAHGCDGWRTKEMQAWPLAVWDTWAFLLNRIEDGDEWPTTIKTAIMAMLPKTDDVVPKPFQKRPITLCCAMYIAWSSLRTKQLKEWQVQIVTPEIAGGRTGGQALDFLAPLLLQLEATHFGVDPPYPGILLDRVKCFVFLHAYILAGIMVALGIPTKITIADANRYYGYMRWIKHGPFVNKNPWIAANGVDQGDVVFPSLASICFSSFGSHVSNLNAQI